MQQQSFPIPLPAARFIISPHALPEGGPTTHHISGLERVRLNDLPHALHALPFEHRDGRRLLALLPWQGEVCGRGERWPREFCGVCTVVSSACCAGGRSVKTH